jgi:hypothetical protein
MSKPKENAVAERNEISGENISWKLFSIEASLDQ